MHDRYIIQRGVGIASAAGLALVLYDAYRFAAPLARFWAAANTVWDLPDARAFGWEITMLMQGDYTGGYCTECGCGFKTYLHCVRSECRWLPSTFSPEATWPAVIEAALHKQALGDTIESPPIEPQTTIPAGGWIIPK